MKTKILITLATFLAFIASPLLGASTNPELLEGTIPEYPEEAREAGIEGIVIVEALIDEQGNVFAADIVSSPDARLNKATLDAVSKWKFSPAEEDGKAIMKVVRIPVNFNLTDPVEDSLSQYQNNAIAAR
jgi:TonB family protein